MRLTCPEQAYADLWQQMTGEKVTSSHAMKLLDARFNKSLSSSTVLIIDELDMLSTKKQCVLYNFFNWPSIQKGKLIVIAIANTMDLPERVTSNRIRSRLGLTRLTFKPYTHEQLQSIVASRLERLNVFQQDAIQLVSRKVASLSGDARRALEICRRATEIANLVEGEKVNVNHVTQAFTEMFSDPKLVAIRNCSEYEQLVLKVIVGEYHRTGIEETSVDSVLKKLDPILKFFGMETLSLPGTISLLGRLSAQRLIISEHYRNGLHTKIKLNVAAEDVTSTLKVILFSFIEIYRIFFLNHFNQFFVLNKTFFTYFNIDLVKIFASIFYTFQWSIIYCCKIRIGYKKFNLNDYIRI